MSKRTNFTFPVTSLVGSSVSNILSYMKHHHVQPKYWPKFVLSFLIAGIFEIFNFWERRSWGKRIREYRMKKSPVFIIGFWRSGTTLLHNLLCQDEKAGYTTTLQTLFPHSFLSQKKWLRRLLLYFVPEKRPFDKMTLNLDHPQEEEYGLTNIHTQSLYKFFLFPADFDIIADEALAHGYDIKAREHWKKEYAKFIVKSMLNTKGTRYIGKNPCNLYRIPLIKEIYPDARFIFIHRSPYQVVESLYQFILSVLPGVQLQNIPAGYNREKIVLLYKRILELYFVYKTRLHSRDLYEVKMDDFLKDKIGHLEKIYNRFNLCGFEAARPAFEAYIKKNPSGGRHFYKIDPETIRLVNLHASHIVKKLGYKLREEKANIGEGTAISGL